MKAAQNIIEESKVASNTDRSKQSTRRGGKATTADGAGSKVAVPKVKHGAKG